MATIGERVVRQRNGQARRTLAALQRKKRLARHFRRVEGQDSGVPTRGRRLAEAFDGRQEVAEPADVDGRADLAKADSPICEVWRRGSRRSGRESRRRRSWVSLTKRGPLRLDLLRGIGKRAAARERVWRGMRREVGVDPVGGLGGGHGEDFTRRSNCASGPVSTGGPSAFRRKRSHRLKSPELPGSASWSER